MGRLRKSGQHRVTIKDIAAMARVSIGTVDRVLHNRGEVNQETRDRVMSFVEELGYTPNLLAKSLALQKSFTIAVLVPDAGDNNLYWKKPLEGFRKAALELNDFNTRIDIFYFDPGREKSFIKEFERVISIHPDGIVMAPHFHEAALKLIPKCLTNEIPLMFIDNNLDGQGLAYFGQDALQSGIVAAKLMHYGLHEGSTVLIVNLAGNKAITRHMQRREKGFMSYFENEVPECGIKTLSTAIDLSRENEIVATLNSLLSHPSQVAGIFVTNSRVHKVAACLTGKEKSRPKLIGYDLVDLNLEYLNKGIIDVLICQKPEDQGYKSAMAMFNHLLTGRAVEKINFSPIDIILKENVDYYRNINR